MIWVVAFATGAGSILLKCLRIRIRNPALKDTKERNKTPDI